MLNEKSEALPIAFLFVVNKRNACPATFAGQALVEKRSCDFD